MCQRENEIFRAEMENKLGAEKRKRCKPPPRAALRFREAYVKYYISIVLRCSQIFIVYISLIFLISIDSFQILI